MLRIVAVFLAISLCQALECVKNEEGAMEFQDKGVVVVPEPFDCMRLTKPAETTLAIKYIDDDDEDRKVCKILDDGIMKEKKVYLKSDVPTDMKCRFICKDSTGLFKCKSQTKKSENACICDHAPHRLIIEPIANGLIGGQNEGEEEMSCAEKPMGFQFPDGVPCVSVQADVHKRRVEFIGGQDGICTVVTSTKSETRYTEAPPTELNLQGCKYVCKPAAPVCHSEEEGGQCECASPGLTKRLVPLDDIDLEGVLRTSACSDSNDCGPCGTCNKETGNCDLEKDAYLKDKCECGEICPSVDNRKSRRGRIMCEPNVKLECMKKARWLRNVYDHFDVGTRYPNYCKPGTTDSMDTCSCAEGYEEIPGPFSGMYCTRRDVAIQKKSSEGQL